MERRILWPARVSSRRVSYDPDVQWVTHLRIQRPAANTSSDPLFLCICNGKQPLNVGNHFLWTDVPTCKNGDDSNERKFFHGLFHGRHDCEHVHVGRNANARHRRVHHIYCITDKNGECCVVKGHSWDRPYPGTDPLLGHALPWDKPSLGTSPLWGQALSWDRPALGTDPHLGIPLSFLFGANATMRR